MADLSNPPASELSGLLHFNDVDGSTSIVDVATPTWFCQGAAAIKTAQSKFGGSSLGGFAAGTDRITAVAANLIEHQFRTFFGWDLWFYINAFSGTHVLLTNAGPGNDINDNDHVEFQWYFSNSTTLNLYYGHRGVNSVTRAFTVPAVSTGVWHHATLNRYQDFVLRCAIDNVFSANTYSDLQQLAHITKKISIGGGPTTETGAASFNGFIDEVHFVKYGTSGYHESYTIPTGEYTGTEDYTLPGVFGKNPAGLNGPQFKHQTQAWQALDATTENGKVGIVFMGSAPDKLGTYRRLITRATWGMISGTVKEQGALVSRLVRCYRKNDGAFCQETLSDPVTGAFAFTDLHPGVEYFVVAYDAEGDPAFNALILDKVLPV